MVIKCIETSSIILVLSVLLSLVVQMDTAYGMEIDLTENQLISSYELSSVENPDSVSVIKIQTIKNKPIRSFDVISDKNIVVLFEKSIIGIYDENFRFVRAYQLSCESHYIRTVNNNLFIYDSRGYYLYKVSVDGKILETFEVPDDTSESLKELFDQQSHDYGGSRLYLSVSKTKEKEPFFIGDSYPYLIRIDETQIKTVLYDVSKKYVLKKVGLALLFSIPVIVWIVIFWTRRRKFANA